jgi:hypothetical protein
MRDLPHPSLHPGPSEGKLQGLQLDLVEGGPRPAVPSSALNGGVLTAEAAHEPVQQTRLDESGIYIEIGASSSSWNRARKRWMISYGGAPRFFLEIDRCFAIFLKGAAVCIIV